LGRQRKNRNLRWVLRRQRVEKQKNKISHH